ncbi:MAG: DMT family transporter [Alphaproteobacteria bacterium]|nr:DMT family transporter [Alphaproteobacteria bacterium]
MSEATPASLAPRTTSVSPAVALIGGGALLLWGGTAIANKIAIGHMDAMTAGVLRSLLAGLIAAGAAFAWRLPFPKPARQRGLLAISGITSFAIWPLLLSLGLGLTTASHAALIMAMIPVFTGLIAAGFERNWPRAGWWTGVVIAVIGAFFLVFYRTDGALLADGGSVAGDLIILSGAGICALGYVAGGKLTPVIGTWSTTFWGLAIASIVLIPTFVLLAPRTDWSSVGAGGWAAIAYLTIMSSLLGYAGWFWALGHGGIARIGSWQFAQPVITLALAAMVLGEALTWPLLVAGGTILVGTAIAQRKTNSP